LGQPLTEAILLFGGLFLWKGGASGSQAHGHTINAQEIFLACWLKKFISCLLWAGLRSARSPVLGASAFQSGNHSCVIVPHSQIEGGQGQTLSQVFGIKSMEYDHELKKNYGHGVSQSGFSF